jgi:methionyl-tRNA synthetase
MVLPEAKETVHYEDFARLDLRTGEIRSCEPHPDADRLLVLQVDLGEGQTRQIVAGIRAHFQPQELIGHQVVIVANLAPARLRGVWSQGMLLAAQDGAGLSLVAAAPTRVPGSAVR